MKFLIAFLVTQSFFAATVSRAEVIGYRSVQRLSLTLLEHCPPADCVLVFSGRSGTAVAAYIEAFTREPSVSVPLSNFRFNPNGGVEDEYLRKLFPKEESELFQHFDRFVDQRRLSGKRVLTVDFGFSGRSQASFTAYLNRWMGTHGMKNQATALPLSSSTAFSRIIESAEEYGIEIDKKATLGRRSFAHFDDQSFDLASPYGAYEIFGEGIAARAPSTHQRLEYRLLVEEMAIIQGRSADVERFKEGKWKGERGISLKIRKLLSSLCGDLFDTEALY